MKINVIGGGLAGSEVALGLAFKGFDVFLYEMRPQRSTEVHKTENFAELVCSNSLKSEDLSNASGVLKREAILLGSMLLEVAKKFRVPAGKALAVDREKFSAEVTRLINEHPKITVIRQEVKSLDLNAEETIWVVATGPLSSPDFENWLSSIFGEDLFFFDAVAPIVSAESIDMKLAFEADRYDKGSGDYINCPLDQDEYQAFWQALTEAEVVPIENFSDKFLFNRCQPVEEIARTGFDALRFGPMKPVGLIDPRTDKQPYAVVQLRKENLDGSLYNLVGFQTRLKWNEQRRVFRLIPALHSAEFVRYGVMHRNTYLNSPSVLRPDLRAKAYDNLFFCGQITGLEGYVEAISSGRFVAINIEQLLKSGRTITLPKESMLGALLDHITLSGKTPLNPVYANFGLLPQVRARGKREKKLMKAERAIETMRSFLMKEGIL